MTKTEQIKNDLLKYFSWLATVTSKMNAEGYFDINRECEDIFIKVLNITYGYHLKNLNDEKKNFPAIDLGDDENRICYQITSTTTLKKLKKQLSDFLKKSFIKDISV